MPTGLTSDLYDGKDVTLRDFLNGIGRYMSFAINQRDSPSGPVERLSLDTSRYEQDLVNTEAELERLRSLTPEQAEVEATVQYDRAKAADDEYVAKKKALRERYEDMRRQVIAWEPKPATDATLGVKRVALEQLDQSIEFDCSMHHRTDPIKLTGEEWLIQAIMFAQRDVKFAKERIQEETERVAQFNEHIDAFHAALSALPE